MPYSIALTGGIASGKSAAGLAFQHLGITVIDADQVARTVVEPGSAGLAAVVAAFGAEILDADGSMNRRRMRERVFADPAARLRLEALLHPLIRRELLLQRDAVRSAYGVLIVPILSKMHLRDEVQRVVVVDLCEAMQLERVMQRDGISEALARQMIAAQESRAERLSQADDVLSNSGSLDALNAAVATLHERYLQLATAPHQTA